MTNPSFNKIFISSFILLWSDRQTLRDYFSYLLFGETLCLIKMCVKCVICSTETSMGYLEECLVCDDLHNLFDLYIISFNSDV